MARSKPAPDNAEEIESNKYNVPDWRNGDDYPEWDNLLPDEQRWEFLRRYKQYRKDWEISKTKRPEPIFGKKFSRPTNWISKEEVAKKYYMNFCIDPSYKKLPESFCFQRPGFDGAKIVEPRGPIPFTKEYEEEYQARKRFGSNWDKENSDLLEERRKSLRTLYWNEGRVRIEFDLKHDLENQIKIAEALLLETRNKVNYFMQQLKLPDGESDPEEYDYVPNDIRFKNFRGANKKAQDDAFDAPYPVLLLRILDARNCKRTYPEIAKVFGECIEGLVDSISEKTLGNWFKSASGMVKRL